MMASYGMMDDETRSAMNLTQQEALEALVMYYKRRILDLEEGLVISNALVEKLRAATENDKQDVIEEHFDA